MIFVKSFINLFSYISFRAITGFSFSFLISALSFPYFIAFLKSKKYNQPINKYLDGHTASKKDTPTCGGALIYICSVFVGFFVVDYKNPVSWLLLFCFSSFFLIGLFDDLRKITMSKNEGMTAKVKFSLQIICSFCCVFLLSKISFFNYEYKNTLFFPFLKNLTLSCGFLYFLFKVFVITGTSNAVNLTDGLDGLATFPLIISFVTIGVFAYIKSNLNLSSHLLYTHHIELKDVVIFLACVIGGCVGFLWHNISPAKIFMGDSGSLSLGALLGFSGVLVKEELLLLLIGFVFVVECISVILQVAYFKKTKGRRLFRMAPIHHHFEKCGMSEMQVVIRFWIIAAFMNLIALSSLKIR